MDQMIRPFILLSEAKQVQQEQKRLTTPATGFDLFSLI